MGMTDIKGLGFLKNVNIGGILSGLGLFSKIIALGLVVAGIFGYIMHYLNQKKLYNQNVHFFEEISGKLVPRGSFKARELTIPNTNLQIFYIKGKNMYLPRPTKAMGINSYWYCVRRNRELINFTLTNLNDEMTEAGVDYDHTDMRYALTNLRELIKRNYRDKATPWWKEYKDVIATAIFIFILTISFFLLMSKLGGLVSQVGQLIDHADKVIQTAKATTGSGIASA